MYITPLFRFHRSKTWMFNDLAPHIVGQIQRLGIKTYVEVDCRGLHHFLRMSDQLLEQGITRVNLNCPNDMFNRVYADIAYNTEEFSECLRLLLILHESHTEPAEFYKDIRTKFNELVAKDVEYTSKLAYLQMFAYKGTFRINGHGELTSPFGTETQPVNSTNVVNEVEKIAGVLRKHTLNLTGHPIAKLLKLHQERGNMADTLFRLPPNIVLTRLKPRGVRTQKEMMEQFKGTNFVLNDFAVHDLRTFIANINVRAVVYTVNKAKVSSKGRDINYPEMIVVGAAKR